VLSYFRIRVINQSSIASTYFRCTSILCPIVEAVPRTLDLHGNFKVAPGGFVSEENSSVANLLAGATFSGGWIDSLNYAQVSIICKSDQAGTLYFEHSNDGSTSIRSQSTAITGLETDAVYFAWTPRAKYFRVRYINGAVNQGSFILQTIAYAGARGFTFNPLTFAPTDSSSALMTKSVLVGKNITGLYNPVPLDNANHLRVNSTPYLYGIAEGDIPAHTPWTKIGFTPSVVTATESDIWSAGGLYTFSAAAGTWAAVSSNNTQDLQVARLQLLQILE
jgi:hypothetical protein